jgi:hypothetical protein
MKPLLIFFSIISFHVAVAQQTAQQYFDYLQAAEITVGTQLVTLSNQLKVADKQQLQLLLQNFRDTVNHTIEQVDDKDAFPKSKYLKQAFVEYLEIFKHIGKHDLKELIDILSEENLEDFHKEDVDDHAEKINNHFAKAEEAWHGARQKFINEHNISTTDNPFKFYLEQTKP